MEGDVFDFAGDEGNGNDPVPWEAHFALKEGNENDDFTQFRDKVI